MSILFSTLTLVTFAPLVGVVILLLLRDEQRDAIRWTALATSLVTFAISLVLLLQFKAGEPGLQLVVRAPWIAAGALRGDYFLGVDGISIWLVLLTTLLVPVAIGAAWGAITERVRAFMVWFLLLEVGMVGAFLAMDLLLFYIFFEFTLVPMIFLIGQWGGARRVYAALKFFLFTFAGSIFMLIAILYLGVTTGTFSYPDLQQIDFGVGSGLQTAPWLFAAFAIAFAIKVPVWPLHTWLPDAHVEAPTPGSVILAGVLLKLGTYGFLRFNLGLFPEVAAQVAPLFGVLGVIGILYGAVTAFAQSDAKKLVAMFYRVRLPRSSLNTPNAISVETRLRIQTPRRSIPAGIVRASARLKLRGHIGGEGHEADAKRRCNFRSRSRPGCTTQTPSAVAGLPTVGRHR